MPCGMPQLHMHALAVAVVVLCATSAAVTAASGTALPVGNDNDVRTAACSRRAANGWLDCGVAPREATVAARLYLTLPHAHGSNTNSSDACAVARRCHDVALGAARTRSFLDLSGVRRMVAPADPRAAATVVGWLHAAGVAQARVTPLGNAVDAVAPVHVLERIFAAPGGLQYRLHRHSDHRGCSVMRATAAGDNGMVAAAASIPDDLRRYVYAVRGVVELPPAQACPSNTRSNVGQLRKLHAGAGHKSSGGSAPQCAHSFDNPANGPSMCAENLRAAVGMSSITSAAPDTPVYMAVYERGSSYSPTGASSANQASPVATQSHHSPPVRCLLPCPVSRGPI